MAANVRHSSESVQHYTPREYVEAARRVLGTIDLDPFSCELANRTVRAARYFCAEATPDPAGQRACGFAESWGRPLRAENFDAAGKHVEGPRVLCNPPGGTFGPTEARALGVEAGSSRQAAAWFRAAREWLAGRARSVVYVCFSLELLQRSQSSPERLTQAGALPVPLDFPICYPARRVAYQKPAGGSERAGAGGIIETGEQPPHASCFVLLPDVGQALRGAIGRAPPEWSDFPQIRTFRREFGQFGRVVVPA